MASKVIEIIEEKVIEIMKTLIGVKILRFLLITYILI
jgi:hypothetical protein